MLFLKEVKMLKGKKNEGLKALGSWILILMPVLCLTNIFKVTDISGLSIRPTDILFLLGWVVWVGHIFLKRNIPIKILAFLVFIGMYVSEILIGIFLINSYDVSWAKNVRFFQTILWGVLALTFITSKRDLERVMISVVISGVILGGFSLGYYLLDPELHRVAGFFSAADGNGLDVQASYNEIGALHVLCMSILVKYHNVITVKQKMAFWIKCALLLNFIGLLLGQSRSAVFALFVLAVCYIFFPLFKALFKGKLPKNIFAILISTIGIIVATVILPDFLTINRISDTFINGSNASLSMSTRFELWERAIDLCVTQPDTFLLGYGSNSISYLLGGSNTSESFYLDQSIAGGMIGLIIILFIWLWPLLDMILFRKKYSIIVPVTVISICVSITGNVVVDPFYGGVTFILLYGTFNINTSNNVKGY
jgi:hypothetical protein